MKIRRLFLTECRKNEVRHHDLGDFGPNNSDVRWTITSNQWLTYIDTSWAFQLLTAEVEEEGEEEDPEEDREEEAVEVQEVQEEEE